MAPSSTEAMAHEGLPSPGLPSPGKLQRGKNRSDTFADLRGWVRRHSTKGDLVDAGQQVSDDHQRAVVTFLRNESRAGLRRKVAKEVLSTLKTDAQFAGCTTPVSTPCESTARSGPRPSLLASIAAEALEEPAFCKDAEMQASCPASRVQAGRPPSAALVDPCADEDEIFRLLLTWLIFAEEEGAFDEVTAKPHQEYRRKVVGFLFRVSRGTSTLRHHAEEVLQRLTTSPSWTVDGILDQQNTPAGGA